MEQKENASNINEVSELCETEAATEQVEVVAPSSYFDGGLFQLIGWLLLGAIVTVCTLGICYPWACCMLYRWEAKHTVIEGRRLQFNGTGMQLFGNWIKWFLLTVITFGIYGFWMSINMRKWKAKHTVFAD